MNIKPHPSRYNPPWLQRMEAPSLSNRMPWRGLLDQQRCALSSGCPTAKVTIHSEKSQRELTVLVQQRKVLHKEQINHICVHSVISCHVILIITQCLLDELYNERSDFKQKTSVEGLKISRQ